MSELPAGWVETQLGRLGHYVNGRAFKPSEWSDKGRPIIRIQNLTRTSEITNLFDGDVEPRYIVEPGDLLVSWSATLGAYFWDGPQAVLNQHIFRVESMIDKRFHKYLVDYVLAGLKAKTHGSGMVHITRKPFDEHPVLLPPRPEQERIVAAIEEQFSRLDVGILALETVRKKLRLMRSALLRDSWERALTSAGGLSRVDDLIGSPLANGRSVPDGPGDGFPVLRLTCVREGVIDDTQWKHGAWTIEEAHQYVVRANDFLVIRGNGSKRLVGRGGLVARDAEVAYPDTLIRVRTDPNRIAARFLGLLWESSAVREQLEGSARTTAGIYKVNQQSLGMIELPAPPRVTQDEILDHAHRQLSHMQLLDREVARASVRSAHLRSSVLAAAFAGKLVRQNPADEPAATLVERIVTERAAHGGHGRSPMHTQLASERASR
jgi:type I restriction enzyme S subunit